jgi:hypothetical protein
MQPDGNFAVYPPSGWAVWAATAPQNQPKCPSNEQIVFGSWAYMVMQNDGNLVTYLPGYGAIWHTNTCCR